MVTVMVMVMVMVMMMVMVMVMVMTPERVGTGQINTGTHQPTKAFVMGSVVPICCVSLATMRSDEITRKYLHVCVVTCRSVTRKLASQVRRNDMHCHLSPLHDALSTSACTNFVLDVGFPLW